MSIYTKELIDWNFNNSITNNFWNKSRNRIIENIIQSLSNDSLSHFKILDIGCGTGVLGRHLATAGYDYWGCEPSPVTEVLFDNNFFCNSTLDRVPLSIRDSINFAILGDVIEHIEDDASFLESIFDLLPNLDYLLITVPAYKSLWNVNDEIAGHYRRYNSFGLSSLVNKLKFVDKTIEIIQVRKMFFFLAILMYVKNILNRLFNLKESSNEINSNTYWDFILNKISLLEEKITLPYGSSLLMVLKVQRKL